jgi:hypothetical protein
MSESKKLEDVSLAVLESEGAEEKPLAIIRKATDVAFVCRAVVSGLAKDIQGKKYVPVEGWCTIATAYGCVPSIREVVEEERGIKAVADLIRANGTVVATAEGFVGLDEPTWSNRPMYARRAMAQTRAISRVCRTAFAFVVTLMDAGLSTTPAEEIPFGGESAATTTIDATPRPLASVASGTDAPERTQATRVRFGKSKGKFLCDIDEADLSWQLSAAKKSVEARDPKWGEANEKWLATVQDEVARRNS